MKQKNLDLSLSAESQSDHLSPSLSPCSYPAVNRYSSSSLSSQASNEVSNITGQSESSDEVFNMQVISSPLIHMPLIPAHKGS